MLALEYSKLLDTIIKCTPPQQSHFNCINFNLGIAIKVDTYFHKVLMHIPKSNTAPGKT